MIEVYLLISMFSQFPSFGIAEASADVHIPALRSPAPIAAPLGAPPSAATAAPPVQQEQAFQLIVDFPEINGLRPGSPVLVEGNLVGRVKKISSKPPVKSRTRGSRSFEVALDLDSSVSAKLALGTCALQALPMTDAKSSRKPVVELFVPAEDFSAAKLALLRTGDRIPGFASYEEFWRSGTDRRTKNG